MLVAGVAELIVGAKWGAIISLRRAISGLPQRSISVIYQESSYGERHRPAAWISFASRGSGVQIPSAPPSSSSSQPLFDFWSLVTASSAPVNWSWLVRTSLVRTSPHQHMVRSSMVPTSNGELPSLMAICLVGAAVMSYGMYTFVHPFCTIWPVFTRGSSSARLYSQCSHT